MNESPVTPPLPTDSAAAIGSNSLALMDQNQLTGIRRVFAQLIDKPSDRDIIDNAKYEEECDANGIEYDPMVTRREVLSWLIYDWANSPMFQVALGLTFPTFLSILATRYACTNNVPFECDYEDNPINSNIILRVDMGGWELKPSSYAAAMVSISAFMQAFFYITFGALADYGTYQHYLFRVMSTLGAGFNLVWIFFGTPDSWLIAGWWGAIGIVFFGLALIFYNAYLPSIVANHWQVRRAIRHNESSYNIARIQGTLTDEMSQYGYACGYCGSFWATIVAVGLFYGLQDTTMEILENYGIQSITNTNDNLINSISSKDELWAKPVIGCNIYYTFNLFNNSTTSNDTYTSYITGIQLTYDDIYINGSLYGSNNNNGNDIIHERFDLDTSINDNDYIKQIKIWYTENTDSISNTISAIQFIQQSGVESTIYGLSTMNRSIIESETDSDNWIFAGYTSYIGNLVDDSGSSNIITGFDFLFMSENDGQYGSLISYQLVMVMIGIWWLVFQIYPFTSLKKRNKPQLPKDRHLLTLSCVENYQTIKKAKQYPNLFIYLITWFMFSDAIGSQAAVGVLFAQDELNFTSVELVILVFELEITAALGAVFFVSLQNFLDWNTKQMLLLHIALLIILPVWGLIGLIPGNTEFGLHDKWEMFFMSAFFGFNTGSLQSYSRSFFALLVPIGLENQMFALYEITDKGSSWIGPLMVAIISNEASMRWAFFYVLFFFSISLPIIWKFVDLEQGLIEAGRLEKDDTTMKNDNNNNNGMSSATDDDNDTESRNSSDKDMQMANLENKRESTLVESTASNTSHGTLSDKGTTSGSE